MSWILIVLLSLGIIVLVKKMFSFENLQDLGIKRYRAGDFAEAISYLEKAIKKKPNHAETIFSLGASYLQQSIKFKPVSITASKISQEKAILNFKKYLKLEPNGYHSPQIIQKLEAIELYNKENI